MRCEANSKSSGQRCKRYCAKGLRRCSRHRPYRGPSLREASRIFLDGFAEEMERILSEPCPAFSLLR